MSESSPPVSVLECSIQTRVPGTSPAGQQLAALPGVPACLGSPFPVEIKDRGMTGETEHRRGQTDAFCSRRSRPDVQCWLVEGAQMCAMLLPWPPPPGAAGGEGGRVDEVARHTSSSRASLRQPQRPRASRSHRPFGSALMAQAHVPFKPNFEMQRLNSFVFK